MMIEEPQVFLQLVVCQWLFQNLAGRALVQQQVFGLFIVGLLPAHPAQFSNSPLPLQQNGLHYNIQRPCYMYVPPTNINLYPVCYNAPERNYYHCMIL